jgi:hypothetical protein
VIGLGVGLGNALGSGGGNSPAFAQRGPTLDLVFGAPITDPLNAGQREDFSLDLRFLVQTYQVAAQYLVWENAGMSAKTFGDIVTFTRASSGTYFDSTGVRQSAGNNVPRIDFDPVSRAVRGLLIEEQRTNVALMSDFTSLTGSAGSQYPNATGWADFFNTGGTRTYVASSVNPNGFALDISGVSNARNFIAFTFSAASNTTYTVSFSIESVSGVTGTVSYVDGTLGTGGSSGSIVSPTSTGRVQYTFTTGAGAGSVNVRLGIGASTAESGNIRISGIQIEAGSFATSYIPTTSAAVTRAADVANVNTLSPWLNPAEGTLYAEASFLALNKSMSDGLVALASGSSANVVGMYRTSTGGLLRMEVRAGGVEQSSYNPALASASAKAAVAYRTNDTNLAVDGVAQTTDTSCGVPTVDRLLIGSVYTAGDFPANGHIRRVLYYPRRLSNAELQALTA